jgi:hypothetical protein
MNKIVGAPKKNLYIVFKFMNNILKIIYLCGKSFVDSHFF